jgi:hypothetical protein
MAIEIPGEIVDMIVQHLVDDHAIATIASVQATARQHQELHQHATDPLFSVPIGGTEVNREELVAEMKSVIKASRRRERIR